MFSSRPVVVRTQKERASQRLSSPALGTSAVIHSVGLTSFALSFKYLVDYPSVVTYAYGSQFQNLTIIGLTLATLTFAAGLAADILNSRRIFLVKNALSVCSAPMEVLISMLYWGLKTIDERLVVPEWAVVSPTADIGFHVIPAIALITDLLLLSPPWTIAALPSIALSSFIAMAYWFWVEHCYYHNGWYPYPLFEKLTTGQRILLFMLSAVMMALITSLLKWLYGWLNRFNITIIRVRPGSAKRD